jgi:hypothetical protein
MRRRASAGACDDAVLVRAVELLAYYQQQASLKAALLELATSDPGRLHGNLDLESAAAEPLCHLFHRCASSWVLGADRG